MYDYAKEVKSHVINNFYRIAIPVIAPIYLILNAIDWTLSPVFGREFLGVRLSLVPVLGLGHVALAKKWPGPWHLIIIWLCAITGSSHMTYFAWRSGDPAHSIYLYSVNLVAGCLFLVFPMSGRQNVVTLASSYGVPLVLILYQYWALSNGSMLPLILLCLGIMIIFGVASDRVDQLRYQSFQQRVHLLFLATTDVLTGLKLRRYFFNRFIQELSVRFRKSTKLVMSLAILDLDNFKEVNDRYGHQVGDQYIRHVAGLIRQSVRVYDVACRYGGDEFAILFPETTVQEAEGIAERIRLLVAGTPLRTDFGEVLVSASIGVSGIVAEIPEDFKTLLKSRNHQLVLVKQMLEIIKTADGLLYASKKEGKNRVRSGAAVEFASELSREELEVLKGYLAYFDEPALLMEIESAEDFVSGREEPFNLYPQDFFFRRCVEGLYRWHRNPEWSETLAVLFIRYPERKDLGQETMDRDFSELFRLSDAACHLDKGVYGVIFFGMREEGLRRVIARVKSKFSKVFQTDAIDCKIAASPLQFPSTEKAFSHNLKYRYRDFSYWVTNMIYHLRHYRFAPGEDIYYSLPRKHLRRFFWESRTLLRPPWAK